MIKSKRMEWTGHAGLRDMKNAYKILVRKTRSEEIT
jgi:hypothetical protein